MLYANNNKYCTWACGYCCLRLSRSLIRKPGSTEHEHWTNEPKVFKGNKSARLERQSYWFSHQTNFSLPSFQFTCSSVTFISLNRNSFPLTFHVLWLRNFISCRLLLLHTPIISSFVWPQSMMSSLSLTSKSRRPCFDRLQLSVN